MITLITPTGSRPAAFSLCEKYMAWQTYKGDYEWLVVSDMGEEFLPSLTMGQHLLHSPLQWKPGINTQRYSLNTALYNVSKDSEAVFIIEDDDYYRPAYIETQLEFLRHADMVGECGVTYYSLRTRGFREMRNYEHASTCQTAFRRSYIPNFYRALHSGEKYFDILLWKSATGAHHKVLLHNGLNLCVGMKGLPGRSGIGVGHEANEFTPDPHFVKLKQLLGADAQVYIDMVGK